MTKITINLILITLAINTCCTGVGIKKSKIKFPNTHFSATVANEPFKVKRSGGHTLLSLFEISDDGVDSVHVYFRDNSNLIFSYKHDGKSIEKQFQGAFKDKGYYEFYFRNKKIEIPPLWPILYSQSHVNRLRLALTNEGDLIVDNLWEESGSIFILGAGSSSRKQSFFKATY